MQYVPKQHLNKMLFLVIIMTVAACFEGCSSASTAGVSSSSDQRSRFSSLKIHVVTQGETLFSIAWRYGVDYKKLAAFNGINAPYTIYPSQKIRLNLSSSAVKAGSDNELSGTVVTLQKTPSSDAVSIKKRSANTTKLSRSSVDLAGTQAAPKWQWPVAGKILALFEGETSLNKGIDLGGKLGEPVVAAAAGRVVYSGSGLRGYGKLLIIKHNEIFLSAYAHNNELLVKEGDVVKAGQRVADMGSSGADRVKLHFEIRDEGNPVDPLKYLPKRY